MGNYYEFTCEKCGHIYSVSLGIGYFHDVLCKKIMDDIESGKCGREIRDVYENEKPYVAVKAEKAVFMCDDCGAWIMLPDASLYAPNSMEKIKERHFGIKTVEELGKIPYTNDGDFHVIKEYKPRCKKCHMAMRKLEDSEMHALPCPSCGTVNRCKKKED